CRHMDRLADHRRNTAERQIDRGLVPAALQYLAMAGGYSEGHNRSARQTAKRDDAKPCTARHAMRNVGDHHDVAAAADGTFELDERARPALLGLVDAFASAGAPHHFHAELFSHKRVQFSICTA